MTGVDRYARTFAALREADEISFVPFVMLGDPGPGDDLEILETLIAAGADMLELGIPFSDPVADGPVIQRAGRRALAAGATPAGCLQTLATVRSRYPDLPIGLLVYANLLEKEGPVDTCRRWADSGVDSVLIADVPLGEHRPYAAAARKAGIAPVALLPMDASPPIIEACAASSDAYVYLLARRGVTGDERAGEASPAPVVEHLERIGGPPAMIGFGISSPSQVGAARRAGVRGAISGSAVVRRIEETLGDRESQQRELTSYVRQMKAATRPAGVV